MLITSKVSWHKSNKKQSKLGNLPEKSSLSLSVGSMGTLEAAGRLQSKIAIEGHYSMNLAFSFNILMSFHLPQPPQFILSMKNALSYNLYLFLNLLLVNFAG